MNHYHDVVADCAGRNYCLCPALSFVNGDFIYFTIANKKSCLEIGSQYVQQISKVLQLLRLAFSSNF